ncbi:hypothetical protein RhiirA5_434454 [Rhizophagus irregularis]|uniref:RNase H type-1 domain-containing protein n=1 Tax=Rhizophagus irregularis TaxID=588596 RepID=A0A2N0NQ14_9GLOM|nr:hypothetical protein RhiirA5_434454 [Rhizophagus irregularis]
MNDPIILILVVPTTFLPYPRNLQLNSVVISYATSLALIQSANPPSTFSAGFNCPVATNDDVFISSLPLSTQTLYTDSSFHQEQNFSSPSMASAWLALDDDGFILDSSPLSFPSCFPSALRSEIYAIIFGLYALSPVELVKVSAYNGNVLNIQVDSLAKAAHSSFQSTFLPLAFCQVPCVLTFNFLPIDMNICHFLRSITNAHNLLSFCLLAQFTVLLGSPTLFNWAGIHFCLSSIKGFASHKNGRLNFGFSVSSSF